LEVLVELRHAGVFERTFQCSAAEIDAVLERADDEDVAERVAREPAHATAVVVEGHAGVMSARGVERGDVDGLLTRGRDGTAAEVDRPAEDASQRDLAERIDGDARYELLAGAAEAGAPHMLAGAVELGEEDVEVAGAHERAAAEIRAHVERPRDDDASVGR